MEYGSLTLVSIESFYNHFLSENDKNLRMYQKYFIFIWLGKKYEVEKLVEIQKNIHIIDIVAFPKQSFFVTKKK